MSFASADSCRVATLFAGTLFKNAAHVPLIFEDEKGELHGNDRAGGFMCGMHMRHEGWSKLINDEKYGGSLIPMRMLYHEHDQDPGMRPEPITPEQCEEVIVHMAAEQLVAQILQEAAGSLC